VSYDLEESLELLAALEDARDVLADSDHLAVLAELEHQVAALNRKLGFDQLLEVEMAVEFLRASEAARRLGMPTKDLLRLVHERKIRYVMVEGIAHLPVDAVEEYRSKAS
jgi:excisionase family DNA binding protein